MASAPVELGSAVDTRAEVERFLQILFDPSDLVELRAFHQEKFVGCTLQLFRPAREVPALIPRLHLANTKGRSNIYAGINPRIREGGSAEDVALARYLFADWDDVVPEALDGLLAAAKFPQPTMVVHSGHGIHAYWRLVEPLTDLGLWRAAQTAIIKAAGCDPVIKDPPRVMRLPGFVNLADPDKDETSEPCRIIGANAEAVYTIKEVAGDVTAEKPQRTVVPSNAHDQIHRLSRATMQFVGFGAAPGERNSRLFAAACDMAGCGFDQTGTEAKLLGPALAAGLTEAEGKATIASAFNKPRGPATPEPTAPNSDDGEFGSALQRLAGMDAAARAVEAVLPKPVPSITTPRELTAPAVPLLLPPSVAAGRIRVTNVVDSDGADGEAVRYHIPLPQIADAVREATGGWPKRAGGILFAVNPEDPSTALGAGGSIPSLRAVRWIKKNEELFAWLGHYCDVRWSTSESRHATNKGTRLNPPTKLEMFAYLKDGPVDSYRSVEVLPHHPPVQDLYYLPCNLPPVVRDVANGGITPFMELVGRFNPETPADRRLMVAALLTPGWGGPAGARPAFVLTSDFGRGSGKTTTANVMADVWGGAMTIGAREEFEQVKKRLLGDDSLSMRVCLMDNVKGRLSGGDIEALITAKVIDGWKPYVGQASRPNLVTWYFTANSPSLSRDLADRSVVIKVGKQAHGNDFIRWANDFVRAHRPAILAEIFEILKEPPNCAIEEDARDRWGAWQDAILTRFADGNDLARLVQGRRGDVDSDQEDAEEIAASVLKLVAEHYPDHEGRRILIPYPVLYLRLLADGVVDKGFGPRQVISWVRDRCASGPLHFLQGKRITDGRGWLYTGDSAGAVGTLDKIEPATSAGWHG